MIRMVHIFAENIAKLCRSQNVKCVGFDHKKRSLKWNTTPVIDSMLPPTRDQHAIGFICVVCVLFVSLSPSFLFAHFLPSVICTIWITPEQVNPEIGIVFFFFLCVVCFLFVHSENRNAIRQRLFYNEWHTRLFCMCTIKRIMKRTWRRKACLN